jgi:flagellar hook-basal body complex protein FliE
MRIESNSSAGAPVHLQQGQAGSACESFGAQLSGSLANLAEMQSAADGAAESVAVGDLSQLHEAVIAIQKASLALEFAVAIRNHVVEGLQELLRTQV